MRNGWEVKKLGEVCEILDSKRKPITQRDRIKGDIPYYGATGILDYVKGHIFNEKLLLLGEDGAKWNSGDECAFIIEGKTWVNNHAHVLRPNRNVVIDEWLVYNLNHQDLSSYISGMTVPKLNQGRMNEIEVPIPSIDEQNRILAILDETCSAINLVKANAEKNLQNSKDLFESYLQNVFANPGKEWEQKRFEDLCKLTRGHNPPKSKFINEAKPGYVRFYQIRDGWSDNYEVFVPDSPQLHKVNPDEILMVAYRHIGKVFRGVSGAFNVALCKISNRDKKVLDDDFLFYIIPTEIVKGELMKRSARSLIPSMSVEHLKEILIPLPPIKEQRNIIKKLNLLQAETKTLETIYQQKLNNLEELKKSILQKAFNGELTHSTEKVTS